MSYSPQPNPWKGIPLVGALIDNIQNFLSAGSFGQPSPATAAPLMDSDNGAAVGTSVKYAREDHVHELQHVFEGLSSTQLGTEASFPYIDLTTQAGVAANRDYNVRISTDTAAGTADGQGILNFEASDVQMNNTSIVVVPATATPLADGTAAVGTSGKFAREDHVHPAPTLTTSLVTSLPGSPTTDQEVIYVDSLTAPTYAWRLHWVAAASAWIFVGGSWLEGTTTVTVPRAGNYYVEIGGQGLQIGASSNDERALTLTAGGITLIARGGQGGGQNNNDDSSIFDKGKMTSLTASQVLTPTVSGTSPVRAYIRIQPVSVT